MRSNSWDNKENTSRGCAATADGSQTLHRKPKSATTSSNSRSKRMRNRSLEMVLDDPTATDSSATKRYHIRTDSLAKILPVTKRSWRWPKYYILKKYCCWGCIFLTELSSVSQSSEESRSREYSRSLERPKPRRSDRYFYYTIQPQAASQKNEECKKFRKRSTSLLQLLFMKCAPFVLAFFCCTTNLCKKKLSIIL